MKYQPYKYQLFAENHILNIDRSGLFLEMGLGKTVVTLTAIDKLVNQWFYITKVLVIAPKRVAETVWKEETEKWDHLNHLRVSKVLGSQKERLEALEQDSDVYVINRENVAWLVNHYKSKFPFDMVVIDELSSFKSPKAQRFRSLRMVMPLVRRVIGLTGTPAPNGLIDLWSQIYLLDRGERLEDTVGKYRDKYFSIGKQSGFVVYKYNLKDGADKEIYSRISDICVSMKSKDYLSLPPVINNDVKIVMPGEIKAKYDEFEMEQIMELHDTEITAVNAAVLSGKLLQFASGAIYDQDRNVHNIHDLKLDALEEILEEAQGKPVLLAFSFRHDANKIKKRFKFAVELKGIKEVNDWNNGKIQLLIAHPASAGHGLNLQFGGHIVVWYSLNWSLELYEQFNFRLQRPGQLKNVIINHLITKGTMDEDVYKALKNKSGIQQALMHAVKARIDKYF